MCKHFNCTRSLGDENNTKRKRIFIFRKMSRIRQGLVFQLPSLLRGMSVSDLTENLYISLSQPCHTRRKFTICTIVCLLINNSATPNN